MEYLPSCLNVKVVRESKNSRESSEWKPFPYMFHQICPMKETPEVSLISLPPVTSTSKVLSLEARPIQSGYRCNTASLGGAIFSPLSMTNKVLNKVRQDQVEEMLLVTPTWQTWYSILLNISMEKPIFLPKYFYPLMKPEKLLHPILF